MDDYSIPDLSGLSQFITTPDTTTFSGGQSAADMFNSAYPNSTPNDLSSTLNISGLSNTDIGNLMGTTDPSGVGSGFGTGASSSSSSNSFLQNLINQLTNTGNAASNNPAGALSALLGAYSALKNPKGNQQADLSAVSTMMNKPKANYGAAVIPTLSQPVAHPASAFIAPSSSGALSQLLRG